MKIGFTYDLRDEYLRGGCAEEDAAELDSPDTINAIESTLQSLGHETVCIGHIKSLTALLAAGERWDLVFNFAEGFHGAGREAQVPALLDAFDIPYTFSDPVVMSLALHKGFTKHALRDMGIPTPDFAIIESGPDIERVHLPFPLFAKPVAEGSSKGIHLSSKIQTRQQLLEVCRSLKQKFRQPVLVEVFCPGREFTVGIVGTGRRATALGVMEIMLLDHADPEVYSYANKVNYETRVHYRLADDDVAREAMAIALEAWKRLGCRDAGRLDLRCDASGRVNLLEVNPLPGLNPKHSDLPILCRLKGIGYEHLIETILASASERLCRDLAPSF